MVDYTTHFAHISDAMKLLRREDCDVIFIKKLSPKNDNSKNQIYLGGSLATFQKIPGVVELRQESASTTKKLSSVGELILSQKLNFFWLDPLGKYQAPHAKLIYYFQYPEIRLSGFLKACLRSPEALRTGKTKGLGNRYLLVGIKNDTTYGVLLCTSRTTGVKKLFSQAKKWSGSDVLRLLYVSKRYLKLDPSNLVKEIKMIAKLGPHKSVSLKKEGGIPETFSGPQGAGYTLEAHLGIPRNSKSAPDKYGYEVKAYNDPPVTLITTEPDFGLRADKGLDAFLSKYGWPGKLDDGSTRFNGKHSAAGKSPSNSKLKLKLHGWDSSKEELSRSTVPMITLEDKRGFVAAGWTMEKIGEAWMKKHAGAVYVHYSRPISGRKNLYAFGPHMFVCEGTSIEKFFKALNSETIYLDPGDRILKSGSKKKRTQWRLHATPNNLQDKLKELYDKVTKVNI